MNDIKEYEIWSEGYIVSGQRSGAMFHGKVEATTLREACASYFKNEPTYSPENNALWGCRLFDNEADARKTFG